MRYFIRLAYFGKNFHGWQVQPNAHTVQELLNKSLSTIVQEEINVVGAGRTDTGVHAKEMYAHFDVKNEIADAALFLNRLNKMLGAYVAVFDLIAVKPDAHARFDAVARSYEYRISQRKDPFQRDFAAYLRYDLDLEKMQNACGFLLGEHDFSSFSKSNTQTHTNICNVTEASWVATETNLVFKIKANRFLRNMVRAIVGSLLEVGRGRMSLSEFEKMIAAKDRRLAGESVPAQGLYLTEVSYPKDILNGR